MSIRDFCFPPPFPFELPLNGMEFAGEDLPYPKEGVCLRLDLVYRIRQRAHLMQSDGDTPPS
eukprot:4798350-Amphidinium_carterae.1